MSAKRSSPPPSKRLPISSKLYLQGLWRKLSQPRFQTPRLPPKFHPRHQLPPRPRHRSPHKLWQQTTRISDFSLSSHRLEHRTTTRTAIMPIPHQCPMPQVPHTTFRMTVSIQRLSWPHRNTRLSTSSRYILKPRELKSGENSSPLMANGFTRMTLAGAGDHLSCSLTQRGARITRVAAGLIPTWDGTGNRDTAGAI